jgi:hypothetical protein
MEILTGGSWMIWMSAPSPEKTKTFKNYKETEIRSRRQRDLNGLARKRSKKQKANL